VEERHKRIISLLEEHAVLNIHELCSMLEVSPATMRRDLTKMEELGIIKRMHGGAVLQNPSTAMARSEQPPSEDPNEMQKRLIAEAAFAMVQPGDTIFIDAGSTTEQMTHQLSTLSDISIVTNSIEIAYKLYKHRDRISTYVCGGTMSGTNPHASIVGPLAEQMISQFKANICFIGTQGIDLQHGITEPHLAIARIKEKMISNSFKVVLVADSSKIFTVKQAFVCPLERIDHFITDDRASAADIQAIRSLGIEVTVVTTEE
jgi:DeoR/GlpR family transcriptional regulator of sugar metabolism